MGWDGVGGMGWVGWDGVGEGEGEVLLLGGLCERGVLFLSIVFLLFLYHLSGVIILVVPICFTLPSPPTI